MGKTCFLIEYRDAPLVEEVKRHIDQGSTMFYVGAYGNFDAMA